MQVCRARSARSEGNVRPGPRACIRRHFVADSFRLGTFLQAAASSSADESSANFRAVESAGFTTGWRAIGSSGEHFGGSCEIKWDCGSGGNSGESLRSASQRRENRGGGERAVPRGTIEPRRRGENLATDQIF